MSYWIRFAGMARPLVMVPGPVKAAVMVTESGELANLMHPTVVGVPRPKLSAATAGWVTNNSMPARTAGTRRGRARREAGQARSARFDGQTGTFMMLILSCFGWASSLFI